MSAFTPIPNRTFPMKRPAALLLFLLFATSLHTQNLSSEPQPDQELLNEWAEALAAEMEEGAEDAQQILMEQLLHLYQNPININTATREELQKIFFLSDLQIEALLFQRFQNKAFYSIYEMQTIEGMDAASLKMLAPLLRFDWEAQTSRKTFQPQADLFIRGQSQLQTQNGYRARPDGSIPFQGSPLKAYTRLEIKALKQVSLGLVAEKDQGEPLFTAQQPGPDYLSGYLQFQTDHILRKIIVGSYKLSSGQGLALQTGHATLKSSATTSIRNRQASYAPSLSVNEGSGCSGVLVDLGGEAWQLLPFVSRVQRDGRLDTLEQDGVVLRSLKSDGYHRTETERAQRKNTEEWVVGLTGKYLLPRMTLEAGLLHYQLEHPLQALPTTYNQHYWQGRSTHNFWLAGSGSVANMHWFAETAFNESAHPALWAGLQSLLKQTAELALGFRHFPLDYYAPLGGALSEASVPAGETGFYVGLELPLPAAFTASGYLDAYSHRAARYGVSGPAKGFDLLLTLHHQTSSDWENTLRFRHRTKGVDRESEEPETVLGEQNQNQLRWQSRFTPGKNWMLTLRGDWQTVQKSGGERSSPGFFLSQDLRYTSNSKKWNVTLRYAVFDAEEYATRIFAYEPDVLYSMSTPAHYGKGNRLVVLGKWTPLKGLDLWLRFSRWHYPGRESIGSGYAEIRGDKNREIKLQLRKRF